ncbi:MAG TPA: YncE family protein [Candidatus Tumulicola sp.]|nr:YncE family protein [Candidatus Tumulicola sp.]HSC30423.1 YncE family protein [Gemmatimonadaceae bacterium]
MTLHRFALAAAAIATLAAVPAPGPGYHIIKTYTLGGEGGWDYLAYDSVGHRLFISRQNRVMVVDPATGRQLGEIPGFERSHGIAFDYKTGHGFATSGGDSSVIMFDLKTLRVLGRTTAAPDADAILFDPATGRVFTFNGDSKSSSVIDGQSGKKIGTVDLGAGPEFGVSDGAGKVYVNLEEEGEVAEIDAKTLKVTRKWPMGSCKGATGLAIDRAHHILFSGCRTKVMAISNAAEGKLITTLPIGAGVDATRYDAGTGDAFASTGDGTLTVIHEDSPDRFSVVETDTTMRGARTMEIDEQNHRVFTVSAKFGPPPAESTAQNPRRRPPMLPDSFTLLILDR